MRSKLTSDPPSRARRRYIALILLFWISGLAAHPELRSQIDELSQAIAVLPIEADSLIQRGDLYRRHGDYEAAAQDFSTARTLQPQHHLIDFYEARLALEQANPEMAERLLSQFLTVHPNHAAGLTLRGKARAAQARFREAADDYAAAIAMTPTPSPAQYLNLARLLKQAGSDHLPDAWAALDEGLDRFPTDVALLGIATDLALKVGEQDRAASYLKAVPRAVRALPQWQARISLLDRL